jgi:hypothetical protein
MFVKVPCTKSLKIRNSFVEREERLGGETVLQRFDAHTSGLNNGTFALSAANELVVRSKAEPVGNAHTCCEPGRRPLGSQGNGSLKLWNRQFLARKMTETQSDGAVLENTGAQQSGYSLRVQYPLCFIFGLKAAKLTCQHRASLDYRTVPS